MNLGILKRARRDFSQQMISGFQKDTCFVVGNFAMHMSCPYYADQRDCLQSYEDFSSVSNINISSRWVIKGKKDIFQSSHLWGLETLLRSFLHTGHWIYSRFCIGKNFWHTIIPIIATLETPLSFCRLLIGSGGERGTYLLLGTPPDSDLHHHKNYWSF